MNQPKYDIIPDIHGQHEKLLRLLLLLGYQQRGGAYRHPEGRKVVFLGDFIDRGPEVLEVLETVKAMLDGGNALAVMGNHEFNAVCFATEDGEGGYLRKHTDKNVKQHAATIAAFKKREDWKSEQDKWVEWFKKLPFFLDLGNLRAVHACWDPAAIEVLKTASMTDFEFLKSATAEEDGKATESQGMTPYRAIENCLKGPEIAIQGGFTDKDGHQRNSMRVRWWDLRVGMTFGEACMPVPYENPRFLEEHHVSKIPQYGATEPPVFFGHYWVPETAKRAPLRHNIVCLDYSAGKQGPLVGCRFNGPEPADWEFVETY